MLERIIGHGLVDVGRALDPDNDALHLVGAVARDAPAQIGWRLDYVLASQPLCLRRASTSSASSARATTHR